MRIGSGCCLLRLWPLTLLPEASQKLTRGLTPTFLLIHHADISEPNQGWYLHKCCPAGWSWRGLGGAAASPRRVKARKARDRRLCMAKKHKHWSYMYVKWCMGVTQAGNYYSQQCRTCWLQSRGSAISKLMLSGGIARVARARGSLQGDSSTRCHA